MITRDTLQKMNVSRLKDFCRHNKIKKFSQKKKQELIELILGQEDLAKFTKPKIQKLNCDIPMKTCKNTIYKKKAIQDLAKKCNIPIIRNGKKLTRRQLCERITTSLLNYKQTKIQPKKKLRQINKRKTNKGRKVPGFFDAWNDVNPGYSEWIAVEPEEEAIEKYIRDTGKITGDILYVGTSYDGRQEYGIVIVDLSKKSLFQSSEDFYYWNPAVAEDDKIINELTKYVPLQKSKKAVKEYIAWYKDTMMF